MYGLNGLSDDAFPDVSDPQGDAIAAQHEDFYMETIDRMAALMLSYGRDRVMADVTEAVIAKIGELSSMEGL